MPPELQASEISDAIDISDGEWQIGDVIQKRFRVLEIFKGGMGIIYIVETLKNKEKFAIKTLQSHFILNNIVYEMFAKEAELWVNLEKHPNIVQALMVSQINSKPFIFLEYVDGESLEGVIKKGRLPIKQTILYMLHICRAMSYAFNKLSIIHRDLKPSNCLLSSSGELKITDFGLAKILSAVSSVIRRDSGYLPVTEEVKKSHATAFQGTLPYMAPELFLATRQATIQTDIYSIGVILYEMLTGRKPVFGDNMADFMTQHSNHKITDVRHERSEIPPILADITMKCLSSDPAKRFANFDVIASILESLYVELYNETPPSQTEKEGTLSFNDWFRRGISLAYLNRHYEAVRSYDEALKIKPATVEVLNAKGDSFFAISFYSEALKCFNRAIAIDPENIEAYIKKGDSYFKLKKFQDAQTCYNNALELEPDNVDGLIAKGSYLLETGSPSRCLSFFEKALSINPDSEIALLQNAKALIKLDKLESAVSLLERACDINPRNAQCWLYQGKILMNLGKYGNAVKCLERAKELIPGNDEVWKNIERCKILTGKYSDTFDVILERIKEYPTDKEIKILMYELYAELGDISGMLEMCDAVISLEDEDFYVYKFRRIELLDRALMFDEAIKESNALLEKKDDDKLRALQEQILGRNEFYEEFISSLSDSAMTVPTGTPEIPPCPPEEEKKYKKVLSKMRRQTLSDLRKVAGEFLAGGEYWVALKLVLLDNEINGESSENWLLIGEILHKLDYIRNSLFSYNMHIQTSENGWRAWRDICYIYANIGLYTESFYFGFKAMALMPGVDPIFIMNLLVYTEASGMSHLLPIICFKAIKKCKEQAYSNLFTALIYSMLGRFTESDRILTQYCENSTDELQYLSRLWMVKNDLLRKNYNHAEKLFLKIKYPINPDCAYCYYGGMVMKNIFHNASALEMFEKVSQNCPQADLATAFVKISENDGMKSAIEALESMEHRKEIAYETGISLALLDGLRGEYERAHAKLEKVYLASPLTARAQLLKIVFEQLSTGNMPLENFEKYMSHHVMDPSAFIVLSHYYLENKIIVKAEEVIEQGLLIHSWSSELLNNKAVLYLLQENYELADYILEKAIFADRHNPYALNNQAIRALQCNKLRKAFLLAGKAQALKKNNIDIIYAKLYIMFLSEDYLGVVREIDYGEEYHKRLFPFALIGCLSCIFSQNYGDADSFADGILEESPENPAAWMLSGYLLTQKKKHKEAIIAYKNAISLDSKNGFSHLALGHLLQKEGFEDDGASEVETGLKILNINKKDAFDYTYILKKVMAEVLKKPKYLISDYEPKIKEMYTLLPFETDIMKNILAHS